MKQINTIKQLKEECINHGGCGEFFITLNYGCKSSKTIYFEQEGDDFNVIHEIDFSDEVMNENDLRKSIIGEAMEAGALYSYND